MARIALIHRYFWPDSAPYGAMLRTIGTALANDGHEVSVLTSQPSYRDPSSMARLPDHQVLDDVLVKRLRPLARQAAWATAVNLILFPAQVARELARGPAPEVVMCSTVPQVTLGWAVSLMARLRGSRFIYHCMDLHPEIGSLSGEFAHPLVFHLLARLDRATMRRADAVVVLSHDMRASVIARDAALSAKTLVVPNMALPSFEDGDHPGISPLADPEPGVLRVVFTGNLGRFQALTDLVAALERLPQQAAVELIFMGSGKAEPELAAAARQLQHPSAHVTFVPQGPVEVAKALMRSAHVGVVSLAPEVVLYAYPSKTSSYAEQGLPMMVICEPDSELAHHATQEGWGWSVAPGDVDGIGEALLAAHRELQSGDLDERRRRVREYARERQPSRITDRWRSLIRQVIETPTSSARKGIA